MKAIVFDRHGGAEVLRATELPDPAPAPGDVRIALRAAALNHLDIWVRNGLGAAITMPHIGGCDGAGVIDRVGTGVDPARAGEEVLIAPGLCCGRCPECLAGRDSRCASFRILGFQGQGTFATHVVVPVANCIPKPPALPWSDAAALPLTLLTAWHMLFTRAALQPGETVWIPGAAGGLGVAAVQLAAAAGARVVASASTPDKTDLATSLGADAVFAACGTLDDAEHVRELTGGRGADVVFDHIGGPHVAVSLAAGARGARIPLCGATAGRDATLALRTLYVPEASLLGCYMGARWELLRALDLVARGQVGAVLDRTFPLADAADAQRRMEARDNLGKIVLIP